MQTNPGIPQLRCGVARGRLSAGTPCTGCSVGICRDLSGSVILHSRCPSAHPHRSVAPAVSCPSESPIRAAALRAASSRTRARSPTKSGPVPENLIPPADSSGPRVAVNPSPRKTTRVRRDILRGVLISSRVRRAKCLRDEASRGGGFGVEGDHLSRNQAGCSDARGGR